MPASTTTAPELTREQVQAILVQPLTAASVFLAAGPRIFDVTAAGPVRIPTLVGVTAPSWHGENELINKVEADFGEVVLLDGIKSLKSLTRFSNELARSSIVALDAALRDRMVLDVAARRQQLGVARVPRGRTRPARRHPEIAAGSSDIPARSPTRPFWP